MNQEKLNSTAYIWNNIAVVYWALRQEDKAAKYFMQSAKKADECGENISLPLHNLIALLIETKQYKKASKILNAYVSELKKGKVESDEFTSRIKQQQIICLDALEEHDKASIKLEELLNDDGTDAKIRVELLTHLIYYYSFINADYNYADKYATKVLEEIQYLKIDNEGVIAKAINNSVFAYLLFRRVDKARLLLGDLSSYVHKDPYATATLGMFHILNGNIDRGHKLYEESISLISEYKTKSRFKQRMYFQLGEAYLERGDTKLSKKYFDKALRLKHGHKRLNNQIKLLTKSSVH